MLVGSDALGVEEGDLEAGGNEVRPWVAKFDPVARFEDVDWYAEELDRLAENFGGFDVIRCDEDASGSDSEMRG